MNTPGRLIQYLRYEWRKAGPLGRVSLIAVPLLLLALVAVVWPRPQDVADRPAATPVLPRATAAMPDEPWTVDIGDGQGAQAGETFSVSRQCVAQRLTYRAELAQLGQSDVWIGFAVVNDDGRSVEMTSSRDVLAYPEGTFDFTLPPGDYRVRVQGRGAEWSYTVECLPTAD